MKPIRPPLSSYSAHNLISDLAAVQDLLQRVQHHAQIRETGIAAYRTVTTLLAINCVAGVLMVAAAARPHVWTMWGHDQVLPQSKLDGQIIPMNGRKLSLYKN